MKTVVAIPAMNSVPTQFAASLALLRKDEDTVIGFKIGSLVYSARNELALSAVKMGADYVLWLDSDMVFEPDTLDRLMKDAQEKQGDIISGVYYKRVYPYTPVLYEKFDITDNQTTHKVQAEIPDHIFEIDACGFGCVLTPVPVLKAVIDKYGAPFNPLNGNGEDLSFCWRARQLGCKIFCDPSVQCGHVGYQIITKSFYDRIMNFGG